MYPLRFTSDFFSCVDQVRDQRGDCQQDQSNQNAKYGDQGLIVREKPHDLA